MKRTLQQHCQRPDSVLQNVHIMQMIQEQKDRRLRYFELKKQQKKTVLSNPADSRITPTAFESAVTTLKAINEVEPSLDTSHRIQLWKRISEVALDVYPSLNPDVTLTMFEDCIPVKYDEIQGVHWISRINHQFRNQTSMKLKDLITGILNNVLLQYDLATMFPTAQDIAYHFINPAATANVKDLNGEINSHLDVTCFTIDVSLVGNVVLVVVRDPLIWELIKSHSIHFHLIHEGYMISDHKVNQLDEQIDFNEIKHALLPIAKMVYTSGILIRNGSPESTAVGPGTRLAIGAHSSQKTKNGLQLIIEEKKTCLSLTYWSNVLPFSLTAIYTPDAIAKISTYPATATNSLFGFTSVPTLTHHVDNYGFLIPETIVHLQAWIHIAHLNEDTRHGSFGYKDIEVLTDCDYTQKVVQLLSKLTINVGMINDYVQRTGKLTVYETYEGQVFVKIDWSPTQTTQHKTVEQGVALKLLSTTFALAAKNVPSELWYGFHLIEIITPEKTVLAVQLINDANLLLNSAETSSFILAEDLPNAREKLRAYGIPNRSFTVSTISKIRRMHCFRSVLTFMDHQDTKVALRNFAALLGLVSLCQFFRVFQCRLGITIHDQIQDVAEILSSKQSTHTILETPISFNIQMQPSGSNDMDSTRWSSCVIDSDTGFKCQETTLFTIQADQEEMVSKRCDFTEESFITIPKYLFKTHKIPFTLSTSVTIPYQGRPSYPSKLHATCSTLLHKRARNS